MNFEELTIPRDQLVDGLLAVTRGLRSSPEQTALEAIGELPRRADSEHWIPDLAARLGTEATAVRYRSADLSKSLSQSGPALLWSSEEPDRVLAIATGGRKWCRLATQPARWVATAKLCELLTDSRHRAVSNEIDSVLDAVPLPSDQHSAVRRGLIEERLSDQIVVEGWSLALPPGAPLRTQLDSIGAKGRILTILGLHGLSTVLVILGWWLIGRGALEGNLDFGWLWAWALLLMTTIPFRAAQSWSSGWLAWTVGAAIKRRLLHGALNLDVDDVRGRGTGGLLGRMIDSERVEALAMNGGSSALLASLELLLAVPVLLAGGAPVAHVALLLGWLVVGSFSAARYLGRRLRWTRLRIAMTRRLVERLVGHRSRAIQQPQAAQHETEDRELENYARSSAEVDRWLPRLQVLLARGWMITALLALIPGAFAGELQPAGVAVSLGGILLVFGALRTIVASLAELGAAGISWRHLQPLLEAASRPRQLGLAGAQNEAGTVTGRVAEASELSYRHVDRDRDAVHDCSLEIRSGERILLEGPSGSGKSTLLALLAGLRKPSRGWLGLRGLDLEAWGEAAWRKKVVCVPQFHDNHLLTGSMAFNLLMGDRWPAETEDFEAAREVCYELGLGPLLEEMPGGLMQPVGESGWQLSHGERTRVFLGRALLQQAELVILDESFAGLDFENCQRALACAEKRGATLLVVAHP